MNLTRKRLPVIVGVRAEFFRCNRLAVVVSRHACSVRSKKAGNLRRRAIGKDAEGTIHGGFTGEMSIKGTIGPQSEALVSCRGCSIGSTHQAGVAAPEAPALARPSLPPGHQPPEPAKPKQRRLVEAARQHAQKQERRMAPSRRHARPNAGKCEGCGGPKPAGEGRRRCDPCKVKAAEVKRERDRVAAKERYHARPESKWTPARNERPELRREGCRRCGGPKGEGQGRLYCAGCEDPVTAKQREAARERARRSYYKRRAA